MNNSIDVSFQRDCPIFSPRAVSLSHSPTRRGPKKVLSTIAHTATLYACREGRVVSWPTMPPSRAMAKIRKPISPRATSDRPRKMAGDTDERSLTAETLRVRRRLVFSGLALPGYRAHQGAAVAAAPFNACNSAPTEVLKSRIPRAAPDGRLLAHFEHSHVSA